MTPYLRDDPPLRTPPTTTRCRRQGRGAGPGTEEVDVTAGRPVDKTTAGDPVVVRSGCDEDGLAGQPPGAGVLVHRTHFGHRAVVGDVDPEQAGIHLGDQLA